MSKRISKLARHLRNLATRLEKTGHSEAVAPEEGKLFRTFNGSVVYVLEIDPENGEGRCVVLRGGHNASPARGEVPGENYVVDSQGWYTFGLSDKKYLNIELVMSLMESIPANLDLPEGTAAKLDEVAEDVEISEGDLLAIENMLDELDDSPAPDSDSLESGTDTPDGNNPERI